MLTLLTTLLATASADEATLQTAANYTLQPERSRLYVLVRYDRGALIPGHDHVVAASDFTGHVTWDPRVPSACDVAIRFPVSALQVDPGNARSWEGLEGTTSDADKSAIAKNMTGKHQLAASLFPDIAFQSTRCEPTENGAIVHGGLSIHGVDAPVKARMTIEADGDEIHARGSFTSDHAAWGLEPFTAMLGSLRNDDALKFVVYVRGQVR
ncbi:MAG: YceI family protein [Alphaproteobacteria bacterium]|nr:YceI family protein [Alphaproteobacteria bacterium]